MRRALKIFKWVVVSVVVLFILVMGVASFALNYVVTPERITPIINGQVDGMIDGQVMVKSVDITLFNSFPNVGVVLDSLIVFDTIGRPVVGFRQFRIELNPYKYLRSKELDIRELVLVSPGMNVVIEEDSTSTLDIFAGLMAADTVDKADTVDVKVSDYLTRLNLRRIAIEGGRFSIDDKLSETTRNFKGLNLELKGRLSTVRSRAKLDFSCESFTLKRSGRMVTQDTPFGVAGDIIIDRDSAKITIIECALGLGKIALSTSGTLLRDSLTRDIATDLAFNIEVPTMGNIIKSIPKSIINVDEPFSADGRVELGGTLKGFYNQADARYPSVDATFKIGGGSVKFDKLPYGVETLDLETRIVINTDTISRSMVEIPKLVVKSNAGVDINSSGRVRDIFGVCRIMMDVVCDVDIAALYKIVPLSDGLRVGGRNRTNIRAMAKRSDIESGNFGAMFLRGSSVFDNLRVGVDGAKLADTTFRDVYLNLLMDYGEFNFGSDRPIRGTDINELDRDLDASLAFSGVALRDRKGREIIMDSVKVRAASQLVRDTTKVTPISGELSLSMLSVDIPDTLSGKITHSTISFATKPSENDATKAQTTLDVVADSMLINAIANKTSIDLDAAVLKVDVYPNNARASGWGLNSVVSFRGLNIDSEYIPMDISMNRSRLTFRDDQIQLYRSRINFGESDITATGSIDNLLPRIFKMNDTGVTAKLSLTSDFVNINEIYNVAMAASENFTSGEVVNDEADILAEAQGDDLQLVMLPEKFKAALDVDIKRMLFMEREVDALKGSVNLSQGVLLLDNLILLSQGSQMNLSAMYNPVSDTLANTLIDISAKQIVIEEIVEMFPSIDSLMPAMRSMEGVVDFQMVARGDLDSTMSYSLPSLRSVMTLRGQNLVLLDGETFADISKLLRFKNKDRNIVDTLAVNVVIREGGRIDVPPFQFVMDRYEFIVGGTQVVDFSNFNVDYAYNVSVIKSPILIKLGVDLTGNIDDFNFKITKAKLKDSDFEGIQNRVDEILSQLRGELSTQLKK